TRPRRGTHWRTASPRHRARSPWPGSLEESTAPTECYTRYVLPVDRYEVLHFLAEGGMGAIYVGKKHGAGGFEKQVVLKQLRPEYTRQPQFIELFLREAKLSAALDHANIVHTIDLVRAGDDYFMVMEHVRGGDLRILLKRARKRKKRLAAAAGLYIAREVLAGL